MRVVSSKIFHFELVGFVPLKIGIVQKVDSSGSELELALKAAEKTGEGIRVVSMPSFFRFDKQSAEYRESVLPSSCAKRVSVEAGVTDLWWKYLGCQGEAVGINRFGFSAPGAQVLDELGMNVDNVVAAVQKVLSK